MAFRHESMALMCCAESNKLVDLGFLYKYDVMFLSFAICLWYRYVARLTHYNLKALVPVDFWN